MWRVPIAVLALSWTLAAQAQTGSDDTAVARAMQGAVATAGKAGGLAQAPTAGVQLPLGGALAVVQASVRARAAPARAPGARLWDDAPLRQRVEAARRRVALMGDGEGADGSVFSFPLSEAVSLGLRYWFLTNEDLARFESAESGSLGAGYETHRFLVRARWQF